MSIRTGWKNHTADVVLGGLIFAVGLWLFLKALTLAPGPGLFPRFILGMMTMTGAGIVATACLSGHAEAPVQNAWGRSIGIPALILIGAGILLYAIGFYLTSPVLIIAVYLWHCRVSSGAVRLWRDPGVAVALAIGATLVFYLIFDRLIGLPAPSGALL